MAGGKESVWPLLEEGEGTVEDKRGWRGEVESWVVIRDSGKRLLFDTQHAPAEMEPE